MARPPHPLPPSFPLLGMSTVWCSRWLGPRLGVRGRRADDLWLFAVLGTVTAMIQLLVQTALARTHPHADVERHVHLHGRTHLAAHECLQGLALPRRHLEHELVVHLEQDA